MNKLITLLCALSFMGVGCMNAETHVTADQEKAFRNRNVEIPPDVYKKMMDGRAKAARDYAERSKAWGKPMPGQGASGGAVPR